MTRRPECETSQVQGSLDRNLHGRTSAGPVAAEAPSRSTPTTDGLATGDAPAATGGVRSEVATPWMTVKETATYTRDSPETVRRALVEYQRTGTSGLKGFQRNANAKHRVHRDDADRWVAGLTPRSKNARPALQRVA